MKKLLKIVVLDLILWNLFVRFWMLVGVLYAYASIGFRAGMLTAADMMEKDVATTASSDGAPS